MKKMLTMIVPLAMVFALGSVSLAADEVQSDLNQELAGDIDGDLQGESDQVAVAADGIEDGNTGFADVELNSTDSRESGSIASKRGRQPRRGQTASELGDVQKYWGDHSSGKSADETPDEDEDDDVTAV